MGYYHCMHTQEKKILMLRLEKKSFPKIKRDQGGVNTERKYWLSSSHSTKLYYKIAFIRLGIYLKNWLPMILRTFLIPIILSTFKWRAHKNTIFKYTSINTNWLKIFTLLNMNLPSINREFFKQISAICLILLYLFLC